MSDAIDADLANRMRAPRTCGCGCGKVTKAEYAVGHYARTPWQERFWAHVEKGEGCWEWTGSARPNGYGRLRVNGSTRSTHRLSYEMHFGPVPAGLYVCHSCDNPRCIRPDHLFLGTARDNSRDRDAKGRTGRQRGEAHPGSKLTADEVRQIRSLLRSGCSPGYAARHYGVSASLISQIGSRTVWAWLDDQ